MDERKYITRSLSAKVAELTRSFPCVLLVGARQVGKSTMLKEMLPEGMRYVTLDDFRMLESARRDPIGFLDYMGAPLCIDEVQYAPDLLRAVKMKVDESGRAGMYWLTGSQRFHMMKGVSESLAGRVGVLEMGPLTQREICGDARAAPFFPSLERMRSLRPEEKSCSLTELYERIWLGGYPALHADAMRNRDVYFDSYLQTYLERDVRSLSQVGDLNAFMRLMQSAASRTGQQLVYADLARDADISPNTAKNWISILEASGIIGLLPPYYTNTSKRLSKSPKLYFMDTGLCSWLCGWPLPDTLLRGAMSGAILETWVYGQLYQALGSRSLRLRLSYYRQNNGTEIDFMLEHEGKLYPMEVKRSSNPAASDLRALSTLPCGTLELQPGVVLCTATEMIPLAGGGVGFPISAM